MSGATEAKQAWQAEVAGVDFAHGSDFTVETEIGITGNTYRVIRSRMVEQDDGT